MTSAQAPIAYVDAPVCSAHGDCGPAWCGHFEIRSVFSLDGGRRCLCYAYACGTATLHWFACRVAPPLDSEVEDPWGRSVDVRILDAPADILLFGPSLAALLDTALDSDGEFDHLAVGRFEQFLHGGAPE